MKKGFYPRLAWTGIKSNKKLYLPYILTCIGMIAMYYIISSLAYSPLMEQMRGGSNMAMVLSLGRGVIAIFAAIFLFYTNSFLIRRRKKEFGLYNILGMNKLNIARILFFESLIVAIISLVGGLILGVSLSKAAELGMLNILRLDIDYSLRISVTALVQSLIIYTIIFALIYANALLQMRRTNPLDLLHSENIGEKPPKGNIFLAIIGILLLGGAYYIAVTIKSPLSAMGYFFVAVIMVIIATYLLFVAGSVVFCRLLQKKKSYYYKANHFVSVSSMVYRMKRNGAGLASICILSTMVLVMLSSTSSLYIGEDDSLHTRYPRDIIVNVGLNSESYTAENLDAIRTAVSEIPGKNGVEATNVYDCRTASISGLLEGGKLNVDVSTIQDFNLSTYDNVYTAYIIPLEDYNRIYGENETLGENEALVYASRSTFSSPTIQIGDSSELTVKTVLKDFTENGDSVASVISSLYIIVGNFDEYIKPLTNLTDYNGNDMLTLKWLYGYDVGDDGEVQNEIQGQIYDCFDSRYEESQFLYNYISCDSVDSAREDFYSMYGGLFFIGIMLSIVFIFAAVLIIYYKQVSEGYEDRVRFEVMQKVGMTKKDIRKSINSQVLTVFFMPLIFAGMHLAFAFPLVWKILRLFGLNNLSLLIYTNIGAFLLFALFYIGIYRITSNTYFSIVSDSKE